MNGSMRYYCADGRRIPEGHDTDDCVPCLRAHRDGIRRQYESTVNIDLVERLQEMDRRIRAQRFELARLNLKTAGPPAPAATWSAFSAWVDPDIDRRERRFASCAFRAGWHAARRTVSKRDVDPEERDPEEDEHNSPPQCT